MFSQTTYLTKTNLPFQNNVIMKKCLLFLAAVLSLTFNLAAIGSEPAGDEPEQDGDNIYQIDTWQNLLWISQDFDRWDKDYVQINDIDFSEADPAIDTWNDGEGWSPIVMPIYPES